MIIVVFSVTPRKCPGNTLQQTTPVPSYIIPNSPFNHPVISHQKLCNYSAVTESFKKHSLEAKVLNSESETRTIHTFQRHSNTSYETSTRVHYRTEANGDMMYPFDLPPPHPTTETWSESSVYRLSPRETSCASCHTNCILRDSLAPHTLPTRFPKNVSNTEKR
jgi:hypothetical protein